MADNSLLVTLQATENEPGDMDLSGLPETAVDSEEDDDEEDIERASDPLMSRDIVRDCLEKDPMDRTDDDIGKHPARDSAAYLHLRSCSVYFYASEAVLCMTRKQCEMQMLLFSPCPFFVFIYIACFQVILKSLAVSQNPQCREST